MFDRQIGQRTPCTKHLKKKNKKNNRKNDIL